MNPIATLFKFLFDDLKKDVQTIKEVCGKIRRGESIIDESSLKNFTFYEFLKQNWPLFLCCLMTFLVGWFVAAKYYQNIANTYIINWIEENSVDVLRKINKTVVDNVTLFFT